MSIIGTYRASGINTTSGSVYSQSIYNVQGYKPSGASSGVLLGMALFVYSGTTSKGDWIPLRREWCT